MENEIEFLLRELQSAKDALETANTELSYAIHQVNLVEEALKDWEEKSNEDKQEAENKRLIEWGEEKRKKYPHGRVTVRLPKKSNESKWQYYKCKGCNRKGRLVDSIDGYCYSCMADIHDNGK